MGTVRPKSPRASLMPVRTHLVMASGPLRAPAIAHQPSELDAIMIPISQTRKLRPGKVKSLNKPPAIEGWGWMPASDVQLQGWFCFCPLPLGPPDPRGHAHRCTGVGTPLGGGPLVTAPGHRLRLGQQQDTAAFRAGSGPPTLRLIRGFGSKERRNRASGQWLSLQGLSKKGKQREDILSETSWSGCCLRPGKHKSQVLHFHSCLRAAILPGGETQGRLAPHLQR